jgi:hypothetical protein
VLKLTAWFLWICIASATLFTYLSDWSFQVSWVRILFNFLTYMGLPILFAFQSSKTKRHLYFYLAFGAFLVTGIGLKVNDFLNWGGGYKVQSIEYIHRFDSRQIEFQMEDLGAIGYNKRTVETDTWLGLLKKASNVDIENISLSEWKKVDIHVNELGLKFP